MGAVLRSPPTTRTTASDPLEQRMGNDDCISNLGMAVFNRPIPNSQPNKSVLQVVQAKFYSINRNNIQSSDANGSADYWPIRHQSDVGQWLCWLANQQPATVTTIAEQINPSLIDQMCPRGSLFIQTRDAVFGILHTRSVYSDAVPRSLPGIRERTMVAGGSIEWEITENRS